MSPRFAELMFTSAVQKIQSEMGSRKSYARFEQIAGGEDEHLGVDEMDFIGARDSFYLASVSETGWPYVQHRGGPAGFLKVLSKNLIGFADYSGNRQYVSIGNLTAMDKVSLLLMDYPNRRRLKILGHAQIVDPPYDTGLDENLSDSGYPGRVERLVIVTVSAIDWNCPQHITPRFTASEWLALKDKNGTDPDAIANR